MSKITITYLIFNNDLWVLVFILLFFVGIAAHASWNVPIGQTHPQNTRFVNINTIINTAIRNNGKIPSVIKKKIYSRIPAPFEIGFLGEFNIGRTLIRLSRLNRLIEKIISKRI